MQSTCRSASRKLSIISSTAQGFLSTSLSIARSPRDVRRLSSIPSQTYRSRRCTQLRQLHRNLHTSIPVCVQNRPPQSRDRGPVSTEDTQTDFGSLNVLGNVPPPTTSIDMTLHDGFVLNNGVRITGGDGLLLVAGEAFSWRPWEGRKEGLVTKKGVWHIGKQGLGLLEVIWPKPDLLILGLGPHTHPISAETRSYINSLGIRIEVQDTRNACAQFNLLATERGVGNVAAALVPIGFRD